MKYPEWPITDAMKLGGPSDPIRLPRYQRGLEWSPSDQVKLIDSILRGYPIGAVLVSKKIEDNPSTKKGEEVYTVLDGHQRLGTIKQYLKSPLEKRWDSLWEEIEYKDGALPEAGAIKQIVLDAIKSDSGFSAVEKSHLSEKLVGWLHCSFKSQYERATKEAMKPPSSSRLFSDFSGLVAKECAFNRTPIQENWLEEIHETVIGAVKLLDHKIPVIVYEGEDSNFSNLFYRLNKSGKKLTPYQEQAAKWSEVYVKHTGKNIAPVFAEAVKVVKKNTDNAVTDMTLAEYFWGFSNVLRAKVPGIVKKDDDPDLSWQIVGYLTGHEIKDRTYLLEKHLVDNYLTRTGGPIDLEHLTKIVQEAAIVVDSSLSFLKSGRTNPVAIKPLRYMAALIAAVAVKLYDLTSAPITTVPPKKRIPAIEKNIRARYIFDWFDESVTQKSRNAQLFDCVWGKDKKGARVGSDWLEKTLNKEEFIENVRRWSATEVEKRSTAKRENVKDQAKLLYQCLYSLSSTTWKTSSSQFDHLIPRKHAKVKPKKTDPDYLVNIDHPGNLGPLDGSLNGAKGDLTITEYYDLKGDPTVTTYKKTFPIKTIQEVQLFEAAELRKLIKKFKKSDYDDFVKKRMEKISKKISDEML